MTDRPSTPLLDTVDVPADLRKLKPEDLRQFADELRAEMISAVGTTGGHLGSGLGVVELTTALHYVFDTPRDKIVWDVGHQCYPHKIITGRRDRIRTLRTGGGLSGFTKRSESEYDPFGAAHSSTSISAALGFAIANKLKNQPGRAIAVIGDGSMSAGMAYEAMNNAKQAGNRLIVILNDNDMSIAPPVGGLSAYLAKLVSSRPFIELREIARRFARKLPEPLHKAAKKTDEYARGMAMGGTLFEELGFYYVGPIDGHNLDHLIPILENVRDSDHGPVLIHAVTMKGKGYAPAEAAADKYHGVQKFDVITGEQAKAPPGPPQYQNVFGETLAKLADTDPRIVAITAAMPSGTGVDKFAKAHPTRSFDVGIAEQHAVTFAAGLAAQGMRPFCAIYSTFLQRAYDQVVHDVAIQNLPVRFAIDRAGLVGADGSTHAGSFDVTYLATLPNFVVMAAADEAELVHMTYTAAEYDAGPIAFRYPRGNGTGVALPEVPEKLEIGKGRVVRIGKTVAIFSLGTRLAEALKAADTLEARGLSTSVIDLRFAKPLDEELIRKTLAAHEVCVTVEENSVGGLGAHVLTLASDEGLIDAGLKLRTLRLPDAFQDQDKPELQYDAAGLNAPQIVDCVLKALRHNSAGVEEAGAPGLSEWVATFFTSINAEAAATLLAGSAAVVSAVWVARKQQKIKEQELRLSLLHERRDLIRQFREFQTKIDGVRDLSDEMVSLFWSIVQEVRLYFDPATAKSVELVFEDAWQLIAATASIKLYREDEMHDEVRSELKKRHKALRNLHENFPVAIRLMVEKTAFQNTSDMDFLKLIQSLDELLYEIMSWLVFYPVTLWRALTKPLTMMDYADSELGDPAARQYSDTLSPPLFLLLTIALTHAAELSLVGQDQLITSKTGLSAFISDDSSLILVRVAFFSIFPLIMAARMVRARHVKLDRGPLKPPFYSQCYVTAPFAMMVSASSILMRTGQVEWEVTGFALLVFALLWFGTLQILWFAHHLRCGYWRAAGHASRAMVEALVLFVVVSQIFR